MRRENHKGFNSGFPLGWAFTQFSQSRGLDGGGRGLLHGENTAVLRGQGILTGHARQPAD